ncbi:MAG: cyclic nucleotide-binding domain-containing protein [Anaerolineales bacterium]|nr:cyclic nucleotide-binding domain-containing protein [Anaerolineales bacterium]
MFVTLSRVPLLEGLKTDELELLKPLFQSFDCRVGETIFSQGETAVCLYLILEGSVELRYKPYDDEPLSLGRVSSGNIFGWSSVVGGPNYTASAICIEDCLTLRIKGKDLRALCETHPDIGSFILDRLAKSVSSRWEHAQEQIRSFLKNSIDENVKEQER